MGLRNIARVHQIVYGEGGIFSVYAPRQMVAPGETPRMEIDPSSPVLLCRVHTSPSPVNNPTFEGYMLQAGDSLELEPGTREVFIAPHSNIPALPCFRGEGTTPLFGFRPKMGDRVDRPLKPTYYRFRDYAEAGAVGAPGETRNIWRVAVPLWDAMRLQIQAVFGGATTGTIQVAGEMRDDLANEQVTPILAPVAIPAGASMQFVRIGDIADPNANMPWARVTVVMAGAGTFDLSIACELLRIVNSG